MNERIKELLKQATKEVNPDDRVWVFSEIDQSKFTELIVQECIDIVSYGGEFCSRPKLVEKLRDHFGVEE